MKKREDLVSNYIVYGSTDLGLTPNFVHIERMEKSRLKNRGKIEPHVHNNIFQFIYISEGTIRFESNDYKIAVEAGSFITIPENTLHSVRFNKKTKGVVITISQLLLLNLFEYYTAVPRSLYKIHVLDSKDQRAYLESLVNKLEFQLFEMIEPHEVTVRSLLVLIIVELYKGIQSDSLISSKEVKVNDSHFTKFIKLIREKAGAEMQLQEYAFQLGITTTHLNRICKHAVGKTASSMIKEYIILEAKRYLAFTSHNVAEVAYLLEFSTPSYFNRYFKKEVGMTPRAYRHTLYTQKPDRV